MKNLITFNNKRFVLLRVLREEDKPIINTWRDHLYADTVLKKDGKLYFCQEILDAEIIEEYTESNSEQWLKKLKEGE